MKVVVIGSGGREHAIVRKLLQSPGCTQLIAIPGNGGIAQNCETVAIKATDIDAITDYCKQNSVDYVVVAPDDPLALGMVDALEQAGISAFGPRQSAAKIESSKVFAKGLMKKYGIPTAEYQVFNNVHSAISYVKTRNVYPVVIKVDGLALGKGVLICQNEKEAEKAIYSTLQEGSFGIAGSEIVIEEFLQGPEVSVLAFCDGKTVVPMVSSMDHKRACDGDMGKNTGGMGCIAPNPYYTEDIANLCMNSIFIPTIKAMQKENAPFSGCLYFGLMLCADGPRVIEYNARFGDPETQVVLPLLQSDLLEIMLACTNGTLRDDMVQFSQNSAACVVMASGGYPEAYQVGYPIQGIEAAEERTIVSVYQAGSKKVDGELQTAGGRVLGVTAVASALPQAVADAYSAVKLISFENAHYRKDIGKSAVQYLLK